MFNAISCYTNNLKLIMFDGTDPTFAEAFRIPQPCSSYCVALLV